MGDVVICPAVAARNALEHECSLDDELALLVVHGVLHLLGWDHAVDEEAERMEARERQLLRATTGRAMIAAAWTTGDSVLVAVVAVLLFCSGFFAMAETSLVRMNKSRARALRDQGRRGARPWCAWPTRPRSSSTRCSCWS